MKKEARDKGEIGQITIEFLILVGLFVLILVSTSVPLAFWTTDDAMDVSLVADARYVTEELGTAAEGIGPGGRRNLTVYVPGYRSQGTVGGKPLINVTTILGTDGNSLTTRVDITRYHSDGTLKRNESYNFSRGLPGNGWKVYSGTTLGNVTEGNGRSYRVLVGWKSINFTRL